MKKLIFLSVLLVLFVCLSLNVKAYDYVKPLVVLQYSDISSYIQEDGYEVVSSTVNTNVCGSYEITYKSEDDTFTRRVIVISKETLCDNGFKSAKKKDIWYHNSEFLKAYRFDGKDVILFNKGDKLQLKIDFKYDVYFNFSDVLNYFVLKHDNAYYFATTLYNEISTYDIYLAKISLDGKILKEATYSGNLVDICKGVYIQDSIYLYGSTGSNNGDFFHESKGDDSFVLKVNLDSLEKEKYYDLSLENKDEIIGLFIDKIPVVVQNAFVDNTNVLRISYLDDQSTYTYINTFSLNNIIDFKANSKNGFILNRYKNKDNNFETILYKIDNRLQYTIEDSYVDSLSMPLELYAGENFQSILFSSSNKISTNTNYYYLRNIYQDGFINNIMGSYQANDDYQLIENTTSIISGSYLYEHTFIRALSFGSDYLIYPNNIIHPSIYVNDNELNYSDKSDVYYDINKFGSYPLKYYYELDDFDLIIGKNIYVNPFVNVSNGETYDIGYILKFNGIAHLNGLLVDSNITLDKEGEYLLTLTGKSLEKLEIEFQIRKQSARYNEDTISSSNVVKNSISINSSKNKVQMKVTKNITEEKSDYSLTYSLIPLGLLLLQVVVYVIVRRKLI